MILLQELHQVAGYELKFLAKNQPYWEHNEKLVCCRLTEHVPPELAKKIRQTLLECHPDKTDDDKSFLYETLTTTPSESLIIAFAERYVCNCCFTFDMAELCNAEDLADLGRQLEAFGDTLANTSERFTDLFRFNIVTEKVRQALDIVNDKWNEEFGFKLDFNKLQFKNKKQRQHPLARSIVKFMSAAVTTGKRKREDEEEPPLKRR